MSYAIGTKLNNTFFIYNGKRSVIALLDANDFIYDLIVSFEISDI